MKMAHVWFLKPKGGMTNASSFPPPMGAYENTRCFLKLYHDINYEI